MNNTAQIDNINEMLPNLSEYALTEASDFIAFLIEKEQKHKMFVKETLESEKDPDEVKFSSAKEAMEFIRNDGE